MVNSERELLEGVIRELIDEYGYSSNQIDTEVQIPKGIRPDCIVYTDEEKKTPFILIEVKRRLLYPIMVDQLATYLRLTGAQYGLLTDGIEKFCFSLVEKEIMEIPNIPRKGEGVTEKLSKQKLKPARNLDYRLQKISDYIFSVEKLSPERVLEELQKLILCKLEDEKSPEEIAMFWISPNEAKNIRRKDVQDAVINRIRLLFDKVKIRYPELYSKIEELRLRPQTISYAIAQWQNYSLSKTPSDVIASAYAQFISKSMYGYLGQYFTPKPLVDFIIKLLNPTKEERILDPACGSGGFLIAAMRHVWKKIDSTEKATHAPIVKARYARNKIFGIDINQKMVATCKMNMLLQGDGHAHIFQADSLSSLFVLEEIRPESFDIVVIDPPSGPLVSDQKVLQNFELGKSRKTQLIPVLFMERCLNMLKPMGHMAIVVPESLLTQASLDYVRNFLLENALIRAIVSLPAQTFIPYSGIKASIILLQKKEKSREYGDYNVFMAEATDVEEETLGEIVRNYRKFIKDGVTLGG